MYNVIAKKIILACIVGQPEIKAQWIFVLSLYWWHPTRMHNFE
jgi:hypothetical protein